MIYLFGDLHGVVNISQLDENHFIQGNNLTKNDYVIVLGDFGIPWSQYNSDNYKNEMEQLDKLSERPFTTLFVDGNHENFDNLENFKIIDKFDSKVHQLSDSVFHLIRGNIYDINNKRFLAFGGALSIDKSYRTPKISWWPQEIPSKYELEYALDNLKKYNNKIDYILSHSCRNRIIKKLLHDFKLDNYPSINDPTQTLLDIIDKQIKFNKWFFGHFHVDWQYNNKYYCLYDKYIRLDTMEKFDVKRNHINIINY